MFHHDDLLLRLVQTSPQSPPTSHRTMCLSIDPLLAVVYKHLIFFTLDFSRVGAMYKKDGVVLL